jgi:uncharacterized SAM-binding protein YcdF (DUF218 family)
LLSTIPFSNILLYPPSLCVLLIVVAVLMVALKFRVTAVLLVVAGLLWVLVWSLPITSLYLGGRLESQHPYKPPRDLPRADVIVIFGGNS